MFSKNVPEIQWVYKSESLPMGHRTSLVLLLPTPQLQCLKAKNLESVESVSRLIFFISLFNHCVYPFICPCSSYSPAEERAVCVLVAKRSTGLERIRWYFLRAFLARLEPHVVE